MQDKYLCPVKINLSLRVLGRRDDGYHELRSVFWKKTGSETVAVSESDAAAIQVAGAKIEGKNLLSSVLEFAQKRISVPKLKIKICKKYPQGSGIGAGSGNAAALLLWLQENCGLKFTSQEAAALGADVAVLTKPNALNYAKGVGEDLSPIAQTLNLHWLLLFPAWQTNTALAYKKLDEMAREQKSDAECEAEAKNILARLAQKQKIGLLPNDFLQVAAREHPEYAAAFKTAEEYGALAWGMCGSGSAMFFLSENDELPVKLQQRLQKEKWANGTELLN